MTSKLILTLDGEIIKDFSLENVTSLTVGRKHENNIQLNDLTVSGRHALITVKGEDVFVEDLGSTNGTLVNGIHIVHTQLQHGDVVQIGHHMFTHMTDEMEDYQPTMFVRAELDETQIVLPHWEMTEEAARLRGQQLGGLKKLNDPMGGNGIEMRKSFSTIGFQGEKFAQISRGEYGYSISSLKRNQNHQSDDVILINGDSIGISPKQLRENDVISIAGIEMQFYYIQ